MPQYGTNQHGASKNVASIRPQQSNLSNGKLDCHYFLKRH